MTDYKNKDKRNTIKENKEKLIKVINGKGNIKYGRTTKKSEVFVNIVKVETTKKKLNEKKIWETI